MNTMLVTTSQLCYVLFIYILAPTAIKALPPLRAKRIDLAPKVSSGRARSNNISLSRKRDIHRHFQGHFNMSGRHRVPWSPAEERKLYEAVRRWRIGNWSAMCIDFQDRTNVNLKDKWRNMVKCGRVRELANQFGHDPRNFKTLIHK